MTRKLFIKTYGCQMNVYDSERMAEALGAEGYVTTDVAEDADMVLLNTCHIREKAAEKLYSDLGRLKPLKAGRPGLTIGVAPGGQVAISYRRRTNGPAGLTFELQFSTDMAVWTSASSLPKVETMMRLGGGVEWVTCLLPGDQLPVTAFFRVAVTAP